MTYIILDTNIISDAQKPRPQPELQEWLTSLAPSKVAIPFQVLFEVAYGIKLVEKAQPEKAAMLAAWQRTFLSLDFAMPIPTPEVALLLAEMAATPALKNYWLGWPDGSSKPRRLRFGSDPMIAATSIVHRMPIATLDVRDYMLIHHYFPLPGVFHPISGEWFIEPEPGWSFEPTVAHFDVSDDHEEKETRITGNVIRLRA